MFAQLAPAAPASDSAEAGIGAPLFDAPTFDAPVQRAPTTPQMPDLPAGPAEATQPPEAEATWPEALADAFEWPSQPGAASPETHAGAHAANSGSAAPDLTLEALEGAHNAEGYQQFDLEPGSLAAFVGDAQGSGAGASEAARALDEFFQEPEQPPLPPVEPEAPTPEAQPAIAPTDYPARLAAARSLREAGSLDEALVEYRALLKNAPDLLPDVLSDLEASLDEQPEHPELHRLLGDARIRQGDYMAALESLNRSVSLTQPGDEYGDE